MITLFDIDQNGKIIPNEHCYAIKFLKDIQEVFTDLESQIKVYSYLFYQTCKDPRRNPYMELTEVEREEIILSDLEINFSLDEPCIGIAIKRLEEMFTTPTRRFYLDAKVGVEKMGEYLKNASIESGRDGNMATYLSALKSLSTITSEFKKVEKDYLEELKRDNIRGGAESSYDE